jgi:hypothetical protein
VHSTQSDPGLAAGGSLTHPRAPRSTFETCHPSRREISVRGIAPAIQLSGALADTVGMATELLGESNMTASQEDLGPFHRQRDGVCHRCGWRGRVFKVGRRERKSLGVDRTYGRLCRDCARDLLIQSKRDPAKSARKAKLRSVRDRDVA